MPNLTHDQLATPILSIPIDPTKTFANCAATPCKALPQGRYQLLEHVRTDTVRRSSDLDKTGKPTTQAPHVQPDANAEPLQSKPSCPELTTTGSASSQALSVARSLIATGRRARRGRGRRPG